MAINRPGTDIQAVLFDLDGTLIDSKLRSEIVLERLFEKRQGIKVRNAYNQNFRGMPTRRILAHIDPQKVNELLADCMVLEEEYRHLARLYPGVVEVLEAFKENRLAVAVITSQARVEMEANRQNFNLDPYVDLWISSDDVEASKPNPAGLQRALEGLECLPQQAVMIGDSRFDMQAGQLAGTKIGAALWGLSDYQELLDCRPDYTFYHVSEMMQLCQ